jgi:hypothetical protein
VRGAYAGRCFFANSPQIVRGSLLIVDTIEESQDAGPNFPAMQPLKIYHEIVVGDPTSVDNLSPASVFSTLTNFWNVTPWADEVLGTLGVITSQTNPFKSRFTVKKSANNLVFLGESSREYSPFFVDTACYYFKKIY